MIASSKRPDTFDSKVCVDSLMQDEEQHMVREWTREVLFTTDLRYRVALTSVELGMLAPGIKIKYNNNDNNNDKAKCAKRFKEVALSSASSGMLKKGYSNHSNKTSSRSNSNS